MPFEKGHKQFNTGRTFIKKGQHLSKKTEFKKGKFQPSGKQNHMWKGGNVSFSGIHKWIKRNWTKKKKCDHCKKIKKLDWANKDHKYQRIRKKWLCLCRSCHQLYDFKKGFR